VAPRLCSAEEATVCNRSEQLIKLLFYSQLYNTSTAASLGNCKQAIAQKAVENQAETLILASIR
jgi:hypothetical protein